MQPTGVTELTELPLLITELFFPPLSPQPFAECYHRVAQDQPRSRDISVGIGARTWALIPSKSSGVRFTEDKKFLTPAELPGLLIFRG